MLRQIFVGIATIAFLIAALAGVDLVLRLELDVVEGHPRIIDGDSIAFGDLNVRLAGIDAPERAQLCSDAKGDEYACGRFATDYLRFLIEDSKVTCRGRGRDRYDRLIGDCRVGGIALSGEMVRRGSAVAYLGDLDAVEDGARLRGLGLWAGEFTRPADWRRERRTASAIAPVGAVREQIAVLAALIAGDRALRAPGDE